MDILEQARIIAGLGKTLIPQIKIKHETFHGDTTKSQQIKRKVLAKRNKRK